MEGVAVLNIGRDSENRADLVKSDKGGLFEVVLDLNGGDLM